MHQMPPHNIAHQWDIVPQGKIPAPKGFLHCVLCGHQPEGHFEHRTEPQAWSEAENLLDVQAKGNERDEEQWAIQDNRQGRS